MSDKFTENPDTTILELQDRVLRLEDAHDSLVAAVQDSIPDEVLAKLLIRIETLTRAKEIGDKALRDFGINVDTSDIDGD